MIFPVLSYVISALRCNGSLHSSYAAQKLGVEQIPEYAPIRFAGHEAGDFLLAPKRL